MRLSRFVKKGTVETTDDEAGRVSQPPNRFIDQPIPRPKKKVDRSSTGSTCSTFMKPLLPSSVGCSFRASSAAAQSSPAPAVLATNFGFNQPVRNANGQFAPNMQELMTEATKTLSVHGLEFGTIEGLSCLVLLQGYKQEQNHIRTMSAIADLKKEILKSSTSAYSTAEVAHPVLQRLPLRTSDDIDAVIRDETCLSALVSALFCLSSVFSILFSCRKSTSPGLEAPMYIRLSLPSWDNCSTKISS